MRSNKTNKTQAQNSRSKAIRRHALPEIAALEPRLLWSVTAATPLVGAQPHQTLLGGKPGILAPSGLNAAAQPTAVSLSWTDNGSASGYYVLRSTNGGKFTTLSGIGVGTANSYVDWQVGAGNSYSYKVESYGNGKTSSPSNTASLTFSPTTVPPPAVPPPAVPPPVPPPPPVSPPPTVPPPPPVAPVAPSGLSASLNGSSIDLGWVDNAADATSYAVLRSADGVNFATVATLSSATATSYSDGSTVAGQTYFYEVEAIGSGLTSTPSNVASLTTPVPPPPVVPPPPPPPVAPAAPSGLAASLNGTSVNLSWVDNSSSATSYTVLRSTDNVNFSAVGTLTSATANSYVDSTVSAGQVYYYEVEALGSGLTSTPSNVASITTPVPPPPAVPPPPPPPSNTVAIATRYGEELVITATGTNDSIAIAQSGSTLTITADQTAYTEAVPTAGVFVYTRGGNDSISIASSVGVRTIVETIDGAATAINSAGTNVSAWIDASDTFSGTGTAHRVSSFAGGVSKAAGASLANPSDSGSLVQDQSSLFGTGPVAGDINQGEVSDCYFLASLAGFAGEKPSVLTEAAVDMGDGTYVVQFHSGSSLSFVRVSDMFAAGPFAGFMFEHPGATGDIWGLVMEKAFAYFRTGANTYSSLNEGWMTEVYSDFGVSSSNFVPSSYSATAFYNMVSTDLANGETVTLGTSGSPPNLVASHCYTLVSVSMVNGVAEYVVRNPWGSSGDSLENGSGYATLTFAQLTANFYEGVQAVG